MKKYFLLSLFFLAGTVFFMYTLYQTTDIAVIDAVVEKATEVLGVKPKFVTEKKERKAKEEKARLEKIEEAKQEVTPIQLPAVDSAKLIAADKEKKLDELATKKKEELTEGLVTGGVKLEKEEKPAETKAVAKEEESEDDGLIVANNAATKKKKTGDEPALQVFNAKVYGNHILKNEAVVTLRFDQPVRYKSQTFESNQIFSAKVNVFDGEAYFKVDKIDQIPVRMEGYNQDMKTKGFPLSGFYKNPKGDVILSDGSDLSFSYN